MSSGLRTPKGLHKNRNEDLKIFIILLVESTIHRTLCEINKLLFETVQQVIIFWVKLLHQKVDAPQIHNSITIDHTKL